MIAWLSCFSDPTKAPSLSIHYFKRAPVRPPRPRRADRFACTPALMRLPRPREANCVIVRLLESKVTSSMKNLLSLGLACCLLLSSKSFGADGLMPDSKRVSRVECLYADVSDISTILATIDSGLLRSYHGKERAAWEQIYHEKRVKLAKELDRLPASGLSGGDTRAIAAMRKQMKAFVGGGALFAPPAKCQDAARQDIAYPHLKSALVACFVEIGNSLSFEGGKINRVSALDLLTETSDPHRRKAVFLAFVPLWQAINGNNEPDSPYRRMIAGAAAEAAKNGSEIDNVARDVGIDPPEVERWLVQILDAWRESSDDVMVEPWDFRFRAGEADRLLGTYIPRESLQPINHRYYRDLGADLKQLGTLYDLAPRPKKAALAYTEFVTHGRMHLDWAVGVPLLAACCDFEE